MKGMAALLLLLNIVAYPNRFWYPRTWIRLGEQHQKREEILRFVLRQLPHPETSGKQATGQ
jgi:hypothetical protein